MCIVGRNRYNTEETRGSDMAQHVVTRLVDDLDGTEATETVTFAFDGKMREIDLNEGNAAAFREALAPYVEKSRVATADGGRVRGRRSGGGRRSGDGRAKTIREWAASKGIEVAPRGRIQADVVAQYDAEHGTAAPVAEAQPELVNA